MDRCLEIYSYYHRNNSNRCNSYLVVDTLWSQSTLHHWTVQQWLGTHDTWLLILDNADDLDMTDTFLPPRYKGHVLLTSRTQAVGGLAHSIEVREMDKEEGTLLLLRRAKVLTKDAPLDQATTQERQHAEAIVTLMDGLPLALDQAGAYVEEKPGATLATYLETYTRRQADLLQQRGQHGNNHPDAVVITWSLNFEQVEQRSLLATDVMRVCAFLAPDDIPKNSLWREQTGLVLS